MKWFLEEHWPPLCMIVLILISSAAFQASVPAPSSHPHADTGAIVIHVSNETNDTMDVVFRSANDSVSVGFVAPQGEQLFVLCSASLGDLTAFYVVLVDRDKAAPIATSKLVPRVPGAVTFLNGSARYQEVPKPSKQSGPQS